MIFAQTPLPLRERLQAFTQACAAIEFDMVTLTVVETQGFNTAIALECPREAGGGILPA